MTVEHTNQEAALSKAVEDILVERNLRGMKTVQPALEEGSYLRAAKCLYGARNVMIGTGFPVGDTFETDGPVGALALYKALETLGANPILVCGPPISAALKRDYRVYELSVGDSSKGDQEAEHALAALHPDVVISIERPGQAQDGGYYNMRGESIAPRSACFDSFIRHAKCPTIAIGDGGNEIGMGNIYEALQQLDIKASVTTVDELLIADVSNWGAYGLMLFLGMWSGKDLLADVNPENILEYLSKLGSVDGVTRLNELTEDGLPLTEGLAVIQALRDLLPCNYAT